MKKEIPPVLINWPVNANGSFICSKAQPMPMPYSDIKGIGSWEHDQVAETDADSDYYIEYKCSSCGHTWRVEMPD